MKPDLIVSWPRNCDYPLWREQIERDRDRFNDIIIIFTETNYGHDYRPFLETEFKLKGYIVDYARAPAGDEDWRNIAVNLGLTHSHADWVFFTEQDFIWLDGFWDQFDYPVADFDPQIFAAFDSDRMHPCAIMVKRSVVDGTRRNFGIKLNVYDHFKAFQNDIEGAGYLVAVINAKTYWHLNGLSHNMTLLERGDQPNFKPDEFKKYMFLSSRSTVNLDPYFLQLCDQVR